MRALFLSALMPLMAVAAWCQGTVNFANGAAGVNAPVTATPSDTPVSGPDWQAELWMQDTNANWIRVSQPSPFLTQTAAGYFLAGSVTVPDVDAGQQVMFRVRAFNTNSLLEGISQPFTVKVGGGKMPPANLAGLQSWSIAGRPELTVALSTNQVAVSWSTGFSSFVLESSDSLTRTNWSLVGQPPTTNGTEISLSVPVGAMQKYYRLRSN